ncbi:hypothetical protein A5724_10500 [Mycobacterium sp. ACS1612]|uniref:hypothetical protein n=1 Tax=Mycobacterium sp. ACS1612 TaxID=1834117 RepID=UPI0007FDD60F|nr:hypothetical protein [Mycobacterium sp. ACS1612]OBF38150.1 hypothetical protein A5724_10500 [Mycobacterium sp. ACS1612]
MTDQTHLVDHGRSRSLCDGGSPDYTAVTAVAADGSTHLLLALNAAVGDGAVYYDAACVDVVHEQVGDLPLEFVRRITVSRRKL